jgi:hypothetical protein
MRATMPLTSLENLNIKDLIDVLKRDSRIDYLKLVVPNASERELQEVLATEEFESQYQNHKNQLPQLQLVPNQTINFKDLQTHLAKGDYKALLKSLLGSGADIESAIEELAQEPVLQSLIASLAAGDVHAPERAKKQLEQQRIEEYQTCASYILTSKDLELLDKVQAFFIPAFGEEEASSVDRSQELSHLFQSMQPEQIDFVVKVGNYRALYCAASFNKYKNLVGVLLEHVQGATKQAMILAREGAVFNYLATEQDGIDIWQAASSDTQKQLIGFMLSDTENKFKNAFHQAAMYGHVKLLNQFLSQMSYEQKKALIVQAREDLGLFIANNYIGVLNLLLNSLTPEDCIEFIISDETQIKTDLDSCMVGNNAEILNLILEHLDPATQQKLIMMINKNDLRRAISDGQKDIIQTVFNHADQHTKESLLNLDNHSLLKAAVKDKIDAVILILFEAARSLPSPKTMESMRYYLAVHYAEFQLPLIYREVRPTSVEPQRFFVPSAHANRGKDDFSQVSECSIS